MKGSVQMTIRRRLLLAAMAAPACAPVLLAACATSAPKVTPPDYIEPGFDMRTVDLLTIAPVLDLRVDRSERLPLDDLVQKHAALLLGVRGYAAKPVTEREGLAALEGSGRVEVLAEAVKGYRIADASRWVMVFALVDYAAKLTFGSTGNAEMVAFVLDQSSGRLVWRHRALGQFGQGGLVGMMLKSQAGGIAVQSAAESLIDAVPPKR